ncbi:MAG TPA: hypothetical protein VIM30_15260 [Candidatus Limnocylindrales bacterium]|jgi:capsular polysaccharide biosynthesis protein
MTDATTHDAAAQATAQVDAPHGDHAPESEPGPINPMAWIAGIGGILLGLVVAVCLAFATGYIT